MTFRFETTPGFHVETFIKDDLITGTRSAIYW